MYAKLPMGDLQPLGSAAHASISREIIRTGDWLTLHWPYSDDFKDFYQHPPLYYWFTAIAFKLFGINDFSAVFFSCLFGVGCILLTYWLGYLLFKDKFLSFMSAMVMVTTPFLFKHSRKCELESIILFFVTLSFIFFLLGVNKNNKYFLLFGVSAGLSYLAKGPPGYAPFGAAVAYILVTRQWRLLLNKWLWLGFLAGLIVPLAWIIPQFVYEHDKYYNQYIKQQILWSIKGRNIPLTLGQKINGYLYYFPVLVTYYLPWGIIGIYGFYKMIRSKLGDYTLMICWIATVWLGFTVAGWKDNYYLLLFWPAWSVGTVLPMTGWLTKHQQKLTAVATVLLGIMIIVLLTPVKLSKVRNPEFSDKQFIQTVQASVPKEKLIITYGLYYWDMISLFPWYVDRGVTHTVETVPELEQKLFDRKTKPNFCFMTTEDYNLMTPKFKHQTKVLYQPGRYVFLTTDK
jgi:4-amino-4-deoxy-L-arabinose transferase-like glycosyltransferase